MSFLHIPHIEKSQNKSLRFVEIAENYETYS